MCVCVSDLVGQQCDESLGLSLQVQVHVEKLAVERLVHLLLPLRAARLLHGPLHAGPVQVAGQAIQEDPHVLGTVQGHAELEDGKIRKEGEKKSKKVKEGGATVKCRWAWLFWKNWMTNWQYGRFPPVATIGKKPLK